jgi:hypothetical protein
LEAAGVEGESDRLLAQTAVGVVRVLFVVVALLVVDKRVGRRPMLLYVHQFARGGGGRLPYATPPFANESYQAIMLHSTRSGGYCL